MKYIYTLLITFYFFAANAQVFNTKQVVVSGEMRVENSLYKITSTREEICVYEYEKEWLLQLCDAIDKYESGMSFQRFKTTSGEWFFWYRDEKLYEVYHNTSTGSVRYYKKSP